MQQRSDNSMFESIPKKRSKKIPVIIILVAVVGILVGVGAAWGISSQTAAPTSDKANQSAEETKALSQEATDKTMTTASDTTEKKADESAQAPAAAASTDSKSGSLKGKVIAIDPGHTSCGYDSVQEPIGPGAAETKERDTAGTSGTTTGTPEWQVNLAVAKKLRTLLQDQGATVVMTHENGDVPVSCSERAAVANEANADICLRLHCDGAGDASVSGFMTLTPAPNQWTQPFAAESTRAAGIMHPIITAEIGANDRGIIERNDMSGFNWSTVPVVLFEMGVMTNPEEDTKLSTDAYQQKLAQAITDGTDAYFGV